MNDAIPVPRCYLAPRGFEKELAEELSRHGATVAFRRERLFGVFNGPEQPVWAENVWLDPRFIPIASISDAAGKLRGMQRNWALYSTLEHRRARLIEERLPFFSARPHVFGTALPTAPVGGWTLWSRECLLASPVCSSPFPHGAAVFAEEKTTPPNRAYLKLWEAFTRLGVFPAAGELCLDLGSSPGGWTWVLASLGARVFSVDKAPLAPHIAAMPTVSHCIGSAFALDPAVVGAADWLFSDVACYPDRLLALVEGFAQSCPDMGMICTIKLAGETDFDAIEAFTRIPGSFAMHLHVNKHELTWVRLGKKAGA